MTNPRTRGTEEPAAPGRGQRGYTLTELVVTLAIVGLIAAIAAPSLDDDQRELDLAVAEIADAMRFARSEALRGGAPTGFRLEPGNKRVRVFRLDTSTSPATLVYDVYHPVSRQPYDVTLDQHPYASADGLAFSDEYQTPCNRVAEVYFDNDGTPWCTDPADALLEKFVLKVTLGARARELVLYGLTGRVTEE